MMESLSETKWDVVLSGTGLQQSLLALALSRSGLNVIHVDPNEYYGGPEAAFSLQEVDEWAQRCETGSGDGLFSSVKVVKTEDADGEKLGFSRSYSLALAPQLIHAKSKLLSQLVSSKAFRQVEFLAVGSVFICEVAAPGSDAEAETEETQSNPSLSRIPSTREDVFSNTAIPARSKRSLMKFLKFVLEYDAEPNVDVWRPHASEPLCNFLASEFKLDKNLQSYIVTLTLSIDGKVTVETGLTAIHRHLTSMGVFGAGFAAVYPKWGGLSEVAQVGCRAGAVGGAVYMLGTGISDVASVPDSTELGITLSNDVKIQAKALVRGSTTRPAGPNSICLSRLTTIVSSKMPQLFESVVDGAPTPAASVVAFPSGSLSDDNGNATECPVYAMVHSADTGECPSGQCTVYLSTVSSSSSRQILEAAHSRLLAAVAHGEDGPPKCLYKLFYEQYGVQSDTSSLDIQGSQATFPPSSLDLAFNDSVLDPVRAAWDMVAGEPKDGESAEYMVFEDREGAVDDQDDLS